jgi:cbb3-type cytochrome c oxidase subunit III
LPRRAGRPPSVLVTAVVAAAVAALAAGCGTGGLPSADANKSTGKRLFTERCGTCHTLADAGAQGRIGPNLDEAFEPIRDQGFRESGIRSLVADQIKYPSPESASPDVPAMPANLVDGDDVDAVAAYVASVAGKETAGGGAEQITATDGKEIFAQAQCGNCHTLADAGTSGTVGPSLDERRPSKELAVDRVTNGRGAMPSFSDRLTREQIEAVADYVSRVAGR